MFYVVCNLMIAHWELQSRQIYYLDYFVGKFGLSKFPHRTGTPSLPYQEKGVDPIIEMNPIYFIALWIKRGT